MQATQNQNQASGASSFEEWRPIPGLESYEVSDIGRICRAAGETLTSIAEAFGIGFQNVGLICQGKTWTHVQA